MHLSVTKTARDDRRRRTSKGGMVVVRRVAVVVNVVVCDRIDLVGECARIIDRQLRGEFVAADGSGVAE